MYCQQCLHASFFLRQFVTLYIVGQEHLYELVVIEFAVVIQIPLPDEFLGGRNVYVLASGCFDNSSQICGRYPAIV